MTDAKEITRLLNEAAQGDPQAAQRVFPLIYRELRQLAAARRARSNAGATLQTTALVHEAYLRIVDRYPDGWGGQRHFYFTAARAMRDILVEDARKRTRGKAGGNLERVEFDEDLSWVYETSPEEVLTLDAALDKLQEQDPDAHQFVLLRFYAGLTHLQLADTLGISVATVERKWRFLRVWLTREMGAPAN